MRHELLAVLGLVLSSNLVSNAQNTVNSEEQKAIDWLKSLYGNLTGIDSTVEDRSDLVKNYTTCYTDQQEDGVCVKKSICKKEPPKIDPATNFIFRDQNCHFLKICCPIDQVLKAEPRKPPVMKSVCGKSNSGANVFRIAEDSTKNGYADFGEFRWMIALLKTGTKKWMTENYIGGGTLIHPSVVMTVAHKVMDMKPNELICRAGEWETQTENEFYIHQDRPVKSIILHEEFDFLYARNNIALLIMQEPFTLEPHIDVACLSPLLPPALTECYSMGWGQNLSNSNKYANILKKIPLPLVRASTCESQYKNTRLGSGYTLHQSLTCAGGEANVDTCIGDGGSSLVCPIGNPKDDRYEVVGMVVYGLECGTINLPGVYANVPYLYSWINEKMTKQGFNKSYIY